MGVLRTTFLTALALVAFAANSLLCRAALGSGAIDPVSFTSLRIAAGALALAPFLARRGGGGRSAARPRSVAAPLALFAYALAFSLAYVSLDAGTGALLLFGAVQLTMIGVALARGERPHGLQLVGLVAAVAGVVFLVAPGVSAPAPVGAALMLLAGFAWGIYSLLGRGTASPRAATARNFLLALPLAAVSSAIAFRSGHLEPRGAVLALTSGALTSGLGYVLWYQALRGHGRTSAAIVQLAVPVLAALGGVAWLDEPLTPRLFAASALTLGGVGLALASGRSKRR